MSKIQSSAEHLTLNADGSSKDIKFQANGVEKASISSAGAFTSTTIDATKLTGNLPAVNASALTNLTAANLTGALPAISGASLTNIPPQGRKNILINGDFRINQRGLTASSVAVTNGAFNIDRAKNYLVGVSGTVALGDAEAVNGTYETPLKYTAGSTASGRIGVYQTVEDYHFGETLTASAWVKSDNANARIVAYDGSTTTSSNTHTGGGGWELLKVTFSQRTNASQLYIWTAIISATVGSVSIASGDYIFITKFQCERGSVATEFERLTNAEQLALCQRYYQRIGGVSRTSYGTLTAHTDTSGHCPLRFMTTMRASPSQTTSATNLFYITGDGQNQTVSSGQTFGTEGINPNGVTIGVTGSSLGSGKSYWFNTTNADGFIAWEAEI